MRLKACAVGGHPFQPVNNEARCPLHRLPSRGRQHRRVRAQVLAEENTCWICGGEGTEDDPLTLDHVIPRAVGGPTTRENGRAAHASCNYRRGDDAA